MAYFSNGSEGMVFDTQCQKCKFGKSPCPIALVQMEYNYDQLKDTSGTARKMLTTLVTYPKFFHLPKPPRNCNGCGLFFS